MNYYQSAISFGKRLRYAERGLLPNISKLLLGNLSSNVITLALTPIVTRIFLPETNDNLITWGYLDNYLQVNSNIEQRMKEREERMKEYMADMTEEQRERFRKRMESQMRRMTNQKIPIYRLMKKAGLKGVLVDVFNEYQKNRYIRH